MAHTKNGATIYDVADRAQVSISTVSRVISSPEQVRETTRVRVMAAIEDLHFVPKAEAVARARKGTRRIGVLAPFFTYPSFVQRLRGVAHALADSPFELVIYNVDSKLRRDRYFATIPLSRNIDGLIVMALPFSDAVGRRLCEGGMQTILVEHRQEPFSSIEIDDLAGGRLAAEYLLRRGHRRVGFVGDSAVPDYVLARSDLRLSGYRQALAAVGADLPDAYVALAPHGLEQARLSTGRLLDLTEPPTAIFAPSDTQAMGALKAARERGVAVPQQLAVIGFDDVDTADFIGLTTVRQPLEESGRVAAELLINRMGDPARIVQHVQLPLTVITRETA